jgi:TRAP transporter TAXI family solute receptor
LTGFVRSSADDRVDSKVKRANSRGNKMKRRYALVMALGAGIGMFISALVGSTARAESIETLRQRANAGTVGVVSGGVDGTYIRIAADLASVLDRGDKLRVLSLIGKGSVQNLSDIIFLRGIDIGIVQSDVLAYAKRERLFPDVDKSIQYIAKLYDEELHILAAHDITRIEELAGKPVNVDLRGSGTAMTASLVFERVGVKIDPTNFDQALALEKLKRGEIAALAYVAGKPARLFRDLKPDDGLRFLPVPASPALLETYLPAELTPADYPLIEPDSRPIETIGVGAVMAVYNWSSDSERYRKVARFVDAFFDNFEAFLQPPRHAKWQEVNLAAEIPGWTRFAPAQAWLKREMAAATGSTARDAYSEGSLGSSDDLEPQKAVLFRDFLRWRREMAIAGGSADGSLGSADIEPQRAALFRDFLRWRRAELGQRR